MDGYSLLLFGHIGFAIVWLGSGVLLNVLATRFERAEDDVGLERMFENVAGLTNTYFVPSSLLVIVFGIALTIDGPWSFGMLWIVLGLVGFGLTFLTGTLWLGPQTERIQELVARDGGLTDHSRALAKRLFVFARIDTVVLFLVVFIMVIKPTGEDTGALVLMGAIFLAALAFLAWSARSIEIPAGVDEREASAVT